MLAVLFFWLSFNAQSELKPTDILLEESVYYNFPLFTGGYDGVGGGDLVDVRNLTAWFYGADEIKTCFHVTKDFGLSAETLKSLIEKAVAEWTDFFEEKNINSYYTVPINTNFTVSEKCGAHDDLVFYFGTGPISYNLNDLRARQLYIKPVAYVNKTDMSEDFLWSRGYIRFVEPYLYLNHSGNLYPDWTNSESTFHMITHELGHVLGFLHTGDSIMSPQIAKNLFALNNTKSFNISKSSLFPSIDQKIYTPESNNDEVWSAVTKISFSPYTNELYLDSQKIHVVYALKNQTVPLIANLHQSEPATFNYSKLIFFNFNERNFTLENKNTSIEIRENGVLILEAHMDGN